MVNTLNAKLPDTMDVQLNLLFCQHFSQLEEQVALPSVRWIKILFFICYRPLKQVSCFIR